MFTSAQKAARQIIKANKYDTSKPSKIPSHLLPETYTLSNLQENLIVDDETAPEEKVLENILILQSSLTNPSRLSRQTGDANSIETLSAWISRIILPSPTLISHSDIPSDNEPAALSLAIKQTQYLATHGLSTLNHLHSLYPIPSSTLPPEILLSLIVYTSSRDAWTQSSLSSLATSLLTNYETQTSNLEFIKDYLLEKVIKPLFSKSRPETVTASGRAAMASSAPGKRYDVEAEKASQPWRYRDIWAVGILEWIVETSNEEVIAQTWHLLTPPILTLLDSSSTSYRSRGLNLLSQFLPKFSPATLAQTGLGPVFEDAVMPTLMFLPSLTPVEESVVLLPAAYGALRALGDVLFNQKLQEVRGGKGREKDEIGNEGKQDKDVENKLWDRVMRKGVLPGYAHANEYPSIVQLLITELGTIIQKMGVHGVKHLKDILPILSTTLTDPFANTRPSLLITALHTLSITIQNTWPRIPAPIHRNTILKTLVICWTNICSTSEESADLEGVREELEKVGRLFYKVVAGSEGGEGFEGDVERLVNADGGLGVLFGI